MTPKKWDKVEIGKRFKYNLEAIEYSIKIEPKGSSVPSGYVDAIDSAGIRYWVEPDKIVFVD